MTPPRLQHVNGSRMRKLRARVMAAYDTCARCGLPVDKTLNWLDPMAPQVGHKIPHSQGGAYDWDNLQLEHRSCNIRAGNGSRRPPRSQEPTVRELPLPTSQPW